MLAKSKWLIFLPIALFLILAIGRALTNMPLGDEGLIAEPAVNLARDGSLGQTIGMFGAIPGEDTARYTYWHPPFSFMLVAVVYKLFGVGLFQARFISVFWGLIGLIAVYYLARTFFENKRKAIILSLSLSAVDYFYIYCSSSSRMDIMAASLCLGGFAVYFAWRKKNFHLSVFLSNLLICLSSLTHPCGILGFLILIFSILYLDRKSFKIKTLFLCLLPYILGAVGWGIYIIQDIDAFKLQFLGGQILITRGGSWASGINWAAISNEIVHRYLYSYGLSPRSTSIFEFFKFPIFLFFMVNLIIAPFFLKGKKRTIWYMLIICFLCMMFIIPNKASYYLCWITPLFILNSVAVWLEGNKIKFINRIYPYFFVSLIILSIGGSVYCIKRNQYHSLYLSDLREFNERYYTGGKIYGTSSLAFFYDFDENIIQDDFTMGFFSGAKSRYFVLEEIYQNEFNRIQEEQRIERYYPRGMLPLLGAKFKNLLDEFNKKGGIKALWDHINKNLTEEYTQVFQGKYYTFYERREDRKNEILVK